MEEGALPLTALFGRCMTDQSPSLFECCDAEIAGQLAAIGKVLYFEAEPAGPIEKFRVRAVLGTRRAHNRIGKLTAGRHRRPLRQSGSVQYHAQTAGRAPHPDNRECAETGACDATTQSCAPVLPRLCDGD